MTSGGQAGEDPHRTLLPRARSARRAGRSAEAMALLKQAAGRAPDSAEILNELANLLQDHGWQEQVLELYRRAVKADPRFRPALQNLGYLLVSQGATEEGLGYLERAQAVAPSDYNRLLIATALPVIRATAADGARWRERLESGVAALAREGVRIDTSNLVAPTLFFAAYDGVDDRELQAHLGRVLAGPDLTRSSGHSPVRRRSRARARIGFLSAYFRDHTIGRFNLGRVQRLDRERFEVVVLDAGAASDPMARAFEAGADTYVRLPADPAAARSQVADEQLDLLLFTDIGMDGLTTTLAYSRMAAVQCATWGHPVTTGSPTIDYFVSSELLEVPGADAHYTETLVRLPSLGTWYPRPVTPPQRVELDLPPGAHFYACPQSLFKLHPSFDPLIAEILRRDPDGRVVLNAGRIPSWTRLIRERIQAVMPDVADRVLWLPALPYEQYLGLLQAAEVLLDPITFGGGRTSYESLAMGTPIVTLPSELMRTRITSALYAKAGYEELVASSTQEYVDLAVALGTDPGYRSEVCGRIESSCDVLFEDDAELRDLESFLAVATS